MPVTSARRTGAATTVRSIAVGESRVVPLLALTVVVGAIFALLGPGFLSSFNINSLTQVAAQSAVIGLAQAALMVMGRINLAVGGIGVVVVAFIGILSTSTGLPLPLILLLALGLGALAGALMAAVELLTGLNSFVVTLAFLSVYQGGVLLLTQATHYQVSDPTLTRIGNGMFLSPYLSPLLAVAVVIGVLLWLFYFRTSPGWKARAVGANQRAAAASGIRVKRTVVQGYMLSGVLSAVAGIMEIARLAEASPSTGSDWLLLSFIGPLLAGVALSGGSISIAGIIIGSLFYGGIFSGLVILNVPTYWLTLAQAVVLLAALVLGQLGPKLARRLAGSRTRGVRNA